MLNRFGIFLLSILITLCVARYAEESEENFHEFEPPIEGLQPRDHHKSRQYLLGLAGAALNFRTSIADFVVAFLQFFTKLLKFW